MKINKFFTDILGANLRNPRWSWGAIDPISNRVFFRVWEDQVHIDEIGEKIVVAKDSPRRKSSPGFNERQEHLARLRNGATGFGVLCKATDPHTKEARAIQSFDQLKLLQFGELIHESGKTYARIVKRVPVEALTRKRTGQSTLVEDLNTILKKRIEATTKHALVSARVGQGEFRSQVLLRWENRCAVSGCTTLDAIRASHIKPWRLCTDKERLDPFNGLPLIASIDALFDAGLVSFESSGELIVSSVLPEKEQVIFGVQAVSLSRIPPPAMTKYLKFHRDNLFRK